MPLQIDSSLCARHVNLSPPFGAGLALLLGDNQVVAFQLFVVNDDVSERLGSG